MQGLLAVAAGPAAPRRSGAALPRSSVALDGTEFELRVAPLDFPVLGGDVPATAINGSVPAPELHWREGDTVTLAVSNGLSVPTSIHWHGLLVPAEMDGVPGLSFPGIAPGETFIYRFPVRQSGTYWYHSHTRFQEQTGMYGAIVIAPRAGERVAAERDYVVLLSDWSQQDPERVFDTLKRMSDFFNFKMPTAPEFFDDVRRMGLSAALEKRRMWNQMRMIPTDFSDVAAIAGRRFAHLMNGRTAEGNWTGEFRAGERIRLRFINGSATTIYDVRIPGLPVTVVAADGQPVEPVSVDEFRISVAETFDVIVTPTDDRAYTIFAQSIGRTGYVRGTLAPRAGMEAEVPRMDRAEWLTTVDMMGAMAHGGMAARPGMAGMPGMEDVPDGAGPGAPGSDTAPSGMANMAGMDHGAHGMPPVTPSTKGDHAAPAYSGRGYPAPQPPGRPARHARTEYQPNVDMHVDMPRVNLDDPGPNLRDLGRSVLTYADLRSIGDSFDHREPTREIELHLTGHMERFVWSFDGLKFSEAAPIRLAYGERVRIILSNDTMMTHPIHLHGMWSELEGPDGRLLVRKHTISVQPAQRIAFRVTADAVGRWAFHCHLLYHMEAGMFREVVVTP
jgi:CopA family copper-resistance protein